MMNQQTIESEPEPKKPYVRPQLHELAGSESHGKYNAYGVEAGRYGPAS